MTLRDLPSDSELRLSQERVKYAMVGGSDSVVGTSITSYDLEHAMLTVRRRAPAYNLETHDSHKDSLHEFQR